MESIQYNAYLAITGVIQGTSKERIYQELGLESLQLCRWYRKLGNLIPVKSTPYATRIVGNIPLINTKHNFFKNYFFQLEIIEWNNLDHSLVLETLRVFQSLRKKYLI